MGKSLLFRSLNVASVEDTETQRGIGTWQPANRKQGDRDPGFLAPPQSPPSRPGGPSTWRHHSVGYTEHEGHQPGSKEPLKRLSLGCTETSDLKKRVAALEGELKQHQESMQAMGEEPRHTAPNHESCAQWSHRMSTLYPVPWASGAKIKATTKGGWA